MKKYKFFSVAVAAVLAAYLVFNFSVWRLYTSKLVADPACAGGDLTRMGYIAGSKACRQNVDDLPRRHVERDEYRGGAVDVVTFGDSFSNGGAGGRNAYYQDYLASFSGVSVLNYPRSKTTDLVSTVSLANNSGYLDRMKAKAVVIECSEKLCLKDLPESFDFEKSVSEQELLRDPTIAYHAKAAQDTRPVKLEFFSQANFKLVRNNILYRFSDHAYFSPVYKAKLDRPFFTVKDSDTLLFFDNDIKGRKSITPERIRRLNDGLNTLHDRLAAKGIELYFMPCVDKYNLYSDYIVNNKYPRSNFFEELRMLPKRYRLIDTKALLAEELQKGEKDVYFADDTHWGWKASEKVFKTVRFTAH